jgi:hypothetical protein
MSTTPDAAPAATPTPAPPSPAQADTPPAAAPAQDATDWKTEARKWEDRAKANKAELEAQQQAIADSQKSAEQKAAEALAAAQASASTAAAKALRYEVAAAKGLDLTLASRLTGSTLEELEADADALMALIPPKAPEAPPAPPVGPTVPGQQPGGNNPAALVTQADIDALGAAGKYDEINRLRREGRLTHLGVAPPKG